MKDSSVPHMDKPCDICGEVGYMELIAVCSKCCIAREHVYCMQFNTKEVPEDWICQECQLGNNDNPKTPCEKEVVEHSLDVVHDDPTHLAGNGKVSIDYERQVHLNEKKALSGKVKFLSTEEAIRLSSAGVRKGCLSWKQLSKPPLPDEMASLSKTPIGSKNLAPRCTSMNLKLHSRVVKPPGLGDVHISSTSSQQVAKTSKEFEEESARTAVKKEHGCKEQPEDARISAREVEASCRKKRRALTSFTPSSSKLSPSIPSGGKFRDTAEPKKSDIEDDGLLKLLHSLRLYHPYLPALYATWKGGFKFHDTATPGDFYGGFLAQPPCKVHRKAYEFSLKMPLVLQVDLLPRADFLQINCINLDDIALYFFPADNIERAKENNAFLFKLMAIQNSVMRSYIDGVELLIFTSKELNEDSRSVIRSSRNTQFFLWGVFRRAKKDLVCLGVKDLPPLLSSQKCACDDFTNMDNIEGPCTGIDMAREKKMVNVDVFVLRQISSGAYGRSEKEATEDITLSKLKISSVSGVSDSNIKCLPTNIDKNSIPANILSKTIFTEKNHHLVDERGMNPVERENLGPLSISGEACRARSPQLQKSMETSNLKGLYKRVKEPALDMVNILFATSSCPLTEKVMRSRLDVKAEGNGDENPAPVGIMKRLKGVTFLNEVSSLSTTGSFRDEVLAISRDKYQLYPVEVKAEVQSHEHDRLGSTHQRYTASPCEMEVPVHWVPPPKNWVKLNTQGISQGHPGVAGAGGIIRDESGQWVLGYILNLGTCTSLAAEFWALHQGLKLLWDKGYRQVLVESTSHRAVESLKQAPSVSDPNIFIIKRCRLLLEFVWKCEICHIAEEQNLCANWLVSQFEGHSSGLVTFEIPPPNLIPLLHNDCIGVAWRHASHQAKMRLSTELKI